MAAKISYLWDQRTWTEWDKEDIELAQLLLNEGVERKNVVSQFEGAGYEKWDAMRLVVVANRLLDQ